MKLNNKKVLLLVAICLLFVGKGYSQYKQDVVYLKNGTVIRGVIIEQVPNVSLKIETVAKNIFAFKMEEIAKMTKEDAVNSYNKNKGILKLSFDDKNTPKLSFELKGGINFAKAVVELEDKTGNKGLIDFHLGGIVGIPITETYSFETGLMFSQKGGKLESSSSANGEVLELKKKVSPNYLDIPLHIKGTFPIDEGVSFFGIVGSTISIALSGKYEETGTVSFEREDDIAISRSRSLKFGNSDTDDLKSLDLGITFGAGLSFNEFSIGLSYDLGLTDLEDITGLPYTGVTSYKNRVFRISVGYRFF